MSANVSSATLWFNRVGAYGGTFEEPDPDYDYWVGDDELRQNAGWYMAPQPPSDDLPSDETFVPIAAEVPQATTSAMQNFELVDGGLFGEETGFPVGHVHPKAELRASWAWQYQGAPNASIKMRVRGRVDADFDLNGSGAVAANSWSGHVATDCLSQVRVMGPDVTAVDEEGAPENLLDAIRQVEGYANIGGDVSSYLRWTVNGKTIEKKTKDGSTEVTPPGATIEAGAGKSHSLDDRSFMFAHVSSERGAVNQTVTGSELAVSVVMLSRVTNNGAVVDGGFPARVNGLGDSRVMLIPNLNVEWTTDP